LAEDLQKLQWRVTVLAPHAPGAATEETLEGVAIKRFRYLWPESQQTVCYQGGALINLRKNRKNLLKLPPLVLAELCATIRLLRRGKFDLLHSHWLLPQGFVGAIAARLTGTPHVITIHGSDVFALSNSLLTPFKRFALAHAEGVTVNSSATRQAVLGIHASIPRLVRIPMGVDPSPANPQQVRRIQDTYRNKDGPLLVFLGRIVEEKGVGDLMEAMADLVRDLPAVSLLVIGEGQDRQRFERLAATRNLGGRVHFTGWVAPADVPSYLAAADMFIGPSWQEAQGLTFIEAMLAGTPVIATKVGGIPDVVIHEQTGLLITPHAPAEIAAAVRKLAASPSLRKRLAENGRALAIHGFTREASARKFSELFAAITHNTARTSG